MAEPQLSVSLDKGIIREDRVVCRFYELGNCEKGDKCRLPHEDDGRRIPDTVCRYYLKERCAYGKKCYFDHVYFFKRDGVKFIQRIPSQHIARFQSAKKMDIGDTSACASVLNTEREKGWQDANFGLRTQQVRTSTAIREPSTIPSSHLSDARAKFENLMKEPEEIRMDCYTRYMNRGSFIPLRNASCPDISRRFHQAVDVPANSETANLPTLKGFPEQIQQTRRVFRSDENSEVHDEMFLSLNENTEDAQNLFLESVPTLVFRK